MVTRNLCGLSELALPTYKPIPRRESCSSSHLTPSASCELLVEICREEPASRSQPPVALLLSEVLCSLTILYLALSNSLESFCWILTASVVAPSPLLLLPQVTSDRFLSPVFLRSRLLIPLFLIGWKQHFSHIVYMLDKSQKSGCSSGHTIRTHLPFPCECQFTH